MAGIEALGGRELQFWITASNGEPRCMFFRKHSNGVVTVNIETDMGYGSVIHRRLTKDEAIELMAWLSEATK